MDQEINVLKTDKSGKPTVRNRDDYKKMGLENCKADKEVTKEEHKVLEKRINEHSRFWCRMLNSGINHGHQDRINRSKLCSSENAAPKYYMYKDHKVEGGFRPVVGGCNSDTLGLSNTLSEVVEAVANAVVNPFEVVSSEDLLSRVAECNDKLKELQAQHHVDWDWNEDYILIGSDVKSLFSSLSAELSGKAIREQFAKSKISWNNIDWKLVTLYIKLQEKFWVNGELNPVKMYLPKRKQNLGRPPSIPMASNARIYPYPNTKVWAWQWN